MMYGMYETLCILDVQLQYFIEILFRRPQVVCKKLYFKQVMFKENCTTKVTIPFECQ